MPDTTSYDLAVLGLGPGGEEVAGGAAQAGRSVLAVDERLVGGECPYYGCIPSKMLLRAAETLAETRRVDGLAGTARAEPDFTKVAARIRDEATDDWDDAAAVERLQGNGARFVRGSGRLAGRDGEHLLIAVGDETFRARRVVLATGTRPSVPPVDGLRELYGDGGDPAAPVWTNREAVRATEAPRSLAVLGGGAIGCELAQGFARFGTRVTVLESAPRILLPEEPEASEVLTEVLGRERVEVRTGVEVQRVSAGGDGVSVHLKDGPLTAVKLLVAAGRTPNLDRVGLEEVGLDPAARTLTVDANMQVRRDDRPVEGLYAVGDITGHGQFTHVSIWQARVLLRHLLGNGAGQPVGGYQGLAWATFTDPEVGRVGMSEQQAREAGLPVRIGHQDIAKNSRGWIHGPGNDGFVKLVADADRGVLVGATVVAPHGGDVLGLLTLAVHAQVPIHRLATMHYAFPTLHRAVLEALGQLS